MLFRIEFLNGIRDGRVNLAFRRWRRPSVRSGGTLLTAVGQLDIVSVATCPIDDISAVDALRAGYSSLEALRSELDSRRDGEVYRIELGMLRPDPRIALRESGFEADADVTEAMRRLQRLDSRANGPAWTHRVLDLLDANPGVRAGDLCPLVGQGKDQFKLNVRKLKNLGLTVSTPTGYRRSPRGVQLLDVIRSGKPADVTTGS